MDNITVKYTEDAQNSIKTFNLEETNVTACVKKQVKKDISDINRNENKDFFCTLSDERTWKRYLISGKSIKLSKEIQSEVISIGKQIAQDSKTKTSIFVSDNNSKGDGITVRQHIENLKREKLENNKE